MVLISIKTTYSKGSILIKLEFTVEKYPKTVLKRVKFELRLWFSISGYSAMAGHLPNMYTS